MDISRALKIDGWMEPAELQWLAGQAATHRRIVEIGSYKGRSTRALADNTNGIVYAIDDFVGPREIEINGRDIIFDQFIKNMDGLQGRLNIIKTDHRSIPPLDFQPDMVFIDGAHEYEAVKADILFWLPKIAKKGLICGHDYTWFPSVVSAVDELLPERKIAPGTSIWFQELL